MYVPPIFLGLSPSVWEVDLSLSFQWRPNPTGGGLKIEYRQPGHWQGGNYRVQTYNSWTGDVKKSLSTVNPNN